MLAIEFAGVDGEGKKCKKAKVRVLSKRKMALTLQV